MLVYIVDWHMKDLKLDQKYKKYFRKSSIKKKELGNLFLEEIQKKNPKSFLEIGIFHGVTARNICELMYKNHGKEFCSGEFKLLRPRLPWIGKTDAGP